jgi:hypothetical protein
MKLPILKIDKLMENGIMLAFRILYHIVENGK